MSLSSNVTWGVCRRWWINLSPTNRPQGFHLLISDHCLSAWPPRCSFTHTHSPAALPPHAWPLVEVCLQMKQCDFMCIPCGTVLHNVTLIMIVEICFLLCLNNLCEPVIPSFESFICFSHFITLFSHFLLQLKKKETSINSKPHISSSQWHTQFLTPFINFHKQAYLH